LICSNCSFAQSTLIGPRVIQGEAKFDDTIPQNIKITESKIELPTKEVRFYGAFKQWKCVGRIETDLVIENS
jgi:hypothetical protein